MRRTTWSARVAIIWLMVGPDRHDRQQVGALERGGGQQVAGLAHEGGFVSRHFVGDVTDHHLPQLASLPASMSHRRGSPCRHSAIARRAAALSAQPMSRQLP